MNNRLRIAGGFAVTAVLLWLAVRDVDFAQVGQIFAHAQLGWVVPAVCCVSLGYLVRTRRWGSLLAPIKRVPFPVLFSALILGFAANNVLPARMGEFVRAHLIGTKAGLSRSTAFSTIVVERVFDGLTLLAFMGILLLLFPLRGELPEIRLVMIASSVIFLSVGAAIVLLLLNERLALALARAVLRRFPASLASRADRLLTNLLNGLQALRVRRHLGAIIILSVIVWSLEASGYFFVLEALAVPLSIEQQALAALFLLVFVNLGIMIPSAPGYIGTFQLFAKIALSAFGVGATLGFSVAILAHAIQYFLVTGAGLAVFVREHLTLSTIVPPAALEPPLGEPTSE
ncbi:MAG: lysylphosphatidylglycerol synthase transmembrane domain-containing protein [Chloroflexota bacterium]|nr:flippase-like domain-containing protein [Dehalococcoidia bacterium]MDW8253747.1 lysylphosphatidylglycerol synthase transmembrane domain-containing protein [Chloroflexota bacterium]